MAYQSSPESGVIDRLLDASRLHAREAVMLASEEEELSFRNALDFAYRAGAVVELLAKAMLALRDQRLLAKAAHEHLLDVVSGAERPRQANLKTTLDASVAVNLAGQADAGLAARVKGAHRVLAVRNAAVHLAGAPKMPQVKDVVADMVAIAEALLKPLGIGSREFWGDQHALALAINSRHTLSISVETRSLVDKARQAYQTFIKGFPEDARSGVVDLLQARTDAASALADEAVEVNCPSCGNNASALYDFEVDVEDDHGS